MLKPFFGSLYDPAYADWVVFLDRGEHKVRQGLYKDGRFRTKDWLKGEHNLWLVVFTTSRFGLSDAAKAARAVDDSASLAEAAANCHAAQLDCRMDITLDGGNPAFYEDDPGTAELTLKREVIKEGQNPLLATALRALAGGLLGDAATTEDVADTAIGVILDSLAVLSGNGSDTLFVGIVRVQMPGNAVVRLSLRPTASHELPAHLGVYRNIANRRHLPWVAGLGVLGTLNAREPRFGDSGVTGHVDPLRTSLLLYVGRTIYTRHTPESRASLSIVGGTNVVTGDLFRDLFLGASLSASSSLSILAGVNYARLSTTDSARVKQNSERSVRVALGVGLHFQ